MPTADDVRALARSSPWRFTHAHFTRRDHHGVVEAWLDRPGELRYRRDGGPVQRVSEGPRSVSVLTFVSAGLWRRGRSWGGSRELKRPGEITPSFREDGLVAARPDMWLDADDPIVEDYHWVAMLDPVELSEGVDLDDVAEVTHHDRRAWRATARPVEDAYSPRCECCALLWGEVSERMDHRTGGPEPSGAGYPEAYEVILDHATGIVVALAPLGPTDRDDLAFDVEVHAAS